jgi:hypothetical protein
VSVRSKQFLQSIYEDPVFALDAINPKIYSISTSLGRIKLLRKQLFFLKVCCLLFGVLLVVF